MRAGMGDQSQRKAPQHSLPFVRRCAYYKGDMQQLLTHYLLQNNANLACRDDFGNTPLHYAVINDNKPYLRIVCNILQRVSQ